MCLALLNNAQLTAKLKADEMCHTKTKFHISDLQAFYSKPCYAENQNKVHD